MPRGIQADERPPSRSGTFPIFRLQYPLVSRKDAKLSNENQETGLCSLPELGVLGGLARNPENVDRAFASCFPEFLILSPANVRLARRAYPTLEAFLPERCSCRPHVVRPSSEVSRHSNSRPERGSAEGRRNDAARIRSEGRKAPRSGRFGSSQVADTATSHFALACSERLPYPLPDFASRFPEFRIQIHHDASSIGDRPHNLPSQSFAADPRGSLIYNFFKVFIQSG